MTTTTEGSDVRIGDWGAARPGLVKLGVLVLALALIGMVLGLGAAVADDAPAQETPAPSSESAVQAVELPSLRTATSDTFRLTNGERETRLYETPVNYRDEQGNWKPIVEGLEETPTGAIVNGENSFDVHLPEDLDESASRVSFGDEWVSQQPVGISTQPAQMQGEVASYQSPASEASFEYAGLSDGVKETIELEGPSSPTSFHFDLNVSNGIEPRLAADGSVEFRNSSAEVVATMPAPTMSDAAQVAAPPDAVKYALEEAGTGAWRLTVEADPAWLSARDRSWPVSIDPTTLPIKGTELECVILNDGAESPRCSPSQTYLVAKANYVSSGTDPIARSLLRFNVASIPSDAYLTSAKVGLYSSTSAANVSRVDMYDVSRSWTNGVSWTYWEAKHDSKHAWTTPGGDFGKYMSNPTSVTTAQRGSAPGWWEFSSEDLRWLVQRWKDGTIPNNGVLVKLAEEMPHVCCFERRVQWEGTAEAEKPYLSVTYIGPAFGDRKVTSPTDGTKTAKRFLLTANWEQSGVEGVTFQYKGEKGWTNIPESQVTSESGSTVKWPLHAAPADRQSKPLYWDASSLTGAKQTAKVQIRAVITNESGDEGYTPAVEGEVNRDLGGPKDATAPIGPGSVDLLTGNFTFSRTDVSMAAFNSNLEFTRSFNSREANADPTGPLGPGWKLGTPMEAAGSSWSGLKLETFTEIEEEETYEYKWAAVKDVEGGELDFEETSPGHWKTPDEASGYLLQEVPGSARTEISLSEPEGNRTVFWNGGSGSEYRLKSISMTGGSGNKTRYIYGTGPTGRLRLETLFAPAAPGVDCSGEFALGVPGCRALNFGYVMATNWGAPESAGERLSSIYFRAQGFGSEFNWPVARYEYDTQGRLIAEYDSRVSPYLKETYTYESTGQLKTITPAGQEPWTMVYGSVPGETPNGRLIAVKRPSLVATNPTAQTTIAYGVPLSGASAPYSMGGEAVAQWGQTDIPVDATAIFPPNEVPASPPSSYTRATVYYMDAQGQLSNVASPPGAGTSAPSITTTETDKYGNVVRELTAQNRLRALQANEPAARSRQIDTHYRYSADGTELQEESGPLHSVRLESGATAEARAHRSVQYTTGGEPEYHLPILETTGALLKEGTPEEEVVDKRTTRYEYNLELRKPTKTIVDPNGLKIVTEMAYDKDTGLPVETRQPKVAGSTEATAGITKIAYYKKTIEGGNGECENTAWAGLPCKISPAAQPGTAGLPQLLVKKILAYNAFAEPTEISESPGGGTENVRLTKITYDNLGRKLTSKIEGGGQAVPQVHVEYSATLGLPIVQKFVCEPECSDNQAVTTSYDQLGRPVSYEDADGNKATTTFDLLGRPATTSDANGSQTFHYDSVTGLLTELGVTGVGNFRATYNADGDLVSRGLPNGITATTEYDETGTPVHLAYVKTVKCAENCTWLDFNVEDSIDGQILSETSNLVNHGYSYDAAGRLTQAQETPTGGLCTTRTYKYDQDSNRESLESAIGVIGGGCPSGGGTKTTYTYDSADRLTGGPVYDGFGRITSLPQEMAGGSALTTGYFSNDMVATQSQNGITNTFELDASLRQRQRLQGGGGLEGNEIFHYDGPGDSPAWTERAGLVTRDVTGIGGELAAVQEVGKSTIFDLTNLHGDVVATAGASLSETQLKATFRFDEFGVPVSGSSGRFGWLGGKQRRTELPSGVLQMGVRSYVPRIGRFLSMDPVADGSASAYDYANADPVNGFDLTGEYACHVSIRSLRSRHSKDLTKWSVAAPVSVGCSSRGKNVRVTAHIRGGFVRTPAGGTELIKPQKLVSNTCWEATSQACSVKAPLSFSGPQNCEEAGVLKVVVSYTAAWNVREGRGASKEVRTTMVQTALLFVKCNLPPG